MNTFYGRHCLGLALVLLLLATSPLAGGAVNTTLHEQRQAYRKAVDLVHAGHVSAALKIQQELADYVLAPYITYHRNRLRLSRLSPAEVNGFRRDYPDLPGAQRIFSQWLESLAARGQWRTFLKHYEPTDSVELQCLRLRALHITGQRDTALDGVEALWTVGESQPKACDPIFQIWQRERLNDAIAWRRLTLATEANQRLLARYLVRFFSSEVRVWAQARYDVHVNPANIERTSRYRTDHEWSRGVIAHGLRRLAGRDAEAARDAWAKYRVSHGFSEAERRPVDEAIDAALAEAGLLDRAPTAEDSAETAVRFALAYLKQQNWPLLQAWIERLPEAERFSDKWQYWLARAVDASHEDSERARLAYRSLAEKRSYYGFLAAQRTGLAVQMNDASRTIGDVEMQRTLAIPAVGRTIELFAVGDEVNARRELLSVIPRLSVEERRATTAMVQRIGYTTLAIHTANRAELRDDLALRFPVLHERLFGLASHATTLPLPLLLAFARQESAFEADARSSANARGVLQMLTSTARLAAKRAGLPAPTANGLYDPAINIPLGASHIAWLLRRYDDVLPFAAAAYNAGEHRVDRWMRERAGVALDVWIDAIPFRETRNYVHNVLAFNQIYAARFGDETPMLPGVDMAVAPR
ncbi:MAG: transglycosylase SLT domain-containing protein [Gammaproteobacteria bacterium]|nr:transglycosylase SLT domain-containing protein [Gammaproteobacteria bacterium]